MWIAGAGILIPALLCYPVTALTIRSAGENILLRAVPASPGTQIRLIWVHSVSKRPVSETYRVSADTELCLKEMVFDHEGPGMPSSQEGETTWRIEEAQVFVTGYTSCLERLNMGISPFGHHLEIGARKMDLVDEIGPDRLIALTIERTPLILLATAEVRQWTNSRNRP